MESNKNKDIDIVMKRYNAVCSNKNPFCQRSQHDLTVSNNSSIYNDNYIVKYCESDHSLISPNVRHACFIEITDKNKKLLLPKELYTNPCVTSTVKSQCALENAQFRNIHSYALDQQYQTYESKNNNNINSSKSTDIKQQGIELESLELHLKRFGLSKINWHRDLQDQSCTFITKDEKYIILIANGHKYRVFNTQWNKWIKKDEIDAAPEVEKVLAMIRATQVYDAQDMKGADPYDPSYYNYGRGNIDDDNDDIDWGDTTQYLFINDNVLISSEYQQIGVYDLTNIFEPKSIGFYVMNTDMQDSTHGWRNSVQGYIGHGMCLLDLAILDSKDKIETFIDEYSYNYNINYYGKINNKRNKNKKNKNNYNNENDNKEKNIKKQFDVTQKSINKIKLAYENDLENKIYFYVVKFLCFGGDGIVDFEWSFVEFTVILQLTRMKKHDNMNVSFVQIQERHLYPKINYTTKKIAKNNNNNNNNNKGDDDSARYDKIDFDLHHFGYATYKCKFGNDKYQSTFIIIVGGKNYKDEELTNGNINIFNVETKQMHIVSNVCSTCNCNFYLLNV